MIGVGIQEPDGVTRDAVRERVEAVEGIRVVWTAASPEDALARASEPETQVVLSSARHPGTLELARRLRSRSPRPDLVVWGVDDAPGEVVRWVESGATGCLGLADPPRDLSSAVRRVAGDRTRFSAEATYRMARRLAELASLCESNGLEASRLSRLTPREREVLELVGRRLSNAEIAERLVIEVSTVKTHVHHILEKLGVGSRQDAARFLLLDHGTEEASTDL